MITIGILNLQGDISEHYEITKDAINKLKLTGNVIYVKDRNDAEKCDGIIISGGESTIIGKLLKETGINDIIKNKKIPILGTCAGMILLAKKVDYKQELLEIIDMEVERNAFGSQKQSFEKEIMIFQKKFHGVFIRAPIIKKVGKNVEILSKFNDKIIGVKHGHNIAISFHPELTNNILIHKEFIKEVLKCVE